MHKMTNAVVAALNAMASTAVELNTNCSSAAKFLDLLGSPCAG